MKEIQADSIIKLVRQHKKICHDKNCGVSLFPLRSLVIELLGRDLQEDEAKLFF